MTLHWTELLFSWFVLLSCCFFLYFCWKCVEVDVGTVIWIGLIRIEWAKMVKNMDKYWLLCQHKISANVWSTYELEIFVLHFFVGHYFSSRACPYLVLNWPSLTHQYSWMAQNTWPTTNYHRHNYNYNYTPKSYSVWNKGPKTEMVFVYGS